MLACASAGAQVPRLADRQGSPCAATADTLADVFPLALGNRWTYHYSYESFNDPYSSPQYQGADTGTVVLQIIDQIATPDSTRWVIQENRSLWMQFNNGSFSGPQASTDTFELVEFHQGRHRIYRTGQPSEVAASVLPFPPGLCDTAKVRRYTTVDSNGTITFMSIDTVHMNPYRFSFTRDVGLSAVRMSDGCTCTYGYGTNHVLRSSSITAVQDAFGPLLPQSVRLEQNYPNPFNPSTTIRYALPVGSHVTLSVYNMLGQQVAELVNGEKVAGTYEARFDGGGLASGVYFCRIHATRSAGRSTDAVLHVRKLLLVR